MACNPDCQKPCCNAAADEPPHWMAPNEDCMGRPTPGYWRQFLTCSDGHAVIGTGNTSEEAAARASKARDEREVELRLPPEMRLKIATVTKERDEARETIGRCPRCGNEIDPDVCHCGDLIKAHSVYSNHSPVPMGCDCGRQDERTMETMTTAKQISDGEVKLVKQLDKFGCGVACCAMLAGQSYEQARKWFMRRRKKPFSDEGMTHYHIFDWLNRHDFTYQHHCKFGPGNILNDPWPLSAFAWAHIWSVTSPIGGHYLIQTSDGRFLCPHAGEIGDPVARYSLPGYIIAIWRNADALAGTIGTLL